MPLPRIPSASLAKAPPPTRSLKTHYRTRLGLPSPPTLGLQPIRPDRFESAPIARGTTRPFNYFAINDPLLLRRFHSGILDFSKNERGQGWVGSSSRRIGNRVRTEREAIGRRREERERNNNDRLTTLTNVYLDP